MAMWFSSSLVQRGTGFSDMDAGIWLISAFFKIEYWNSQDKLFLSFREALQNLSLFRQLFFSWFPMGDQRKNAEKLPKLYIGFSGFFFGPPLETMKKKLSKWAQILWGFTKS